MSTTTAGKEVAAPRKTLPELLNDAKTRQRFEGLLGKDARSFMQNILTVYQAPGQALAACDPESILAAASISASINLSILPSLGHSCLVPYKDGDRVVAQWQIMWKGLVQLAHRSGQYAKVNLARVYEGQLVSHNPFTGEVVLDANRKKSDRVQGYYFFFALKNGARFEFYWSAKKCIEHGLRYSKSFQKGGGKWAEDPEFAKAKSVNAWLEQKESFLTEGSGADAMSAKTIVKNELNKWGPLETRIKEMVQDFDQAVVGADGKPAYIDSTVVTEGEQAAGTYTAPPMSAKGAEKPAPAFRINWARDAAGKQGITADHFDKWLEAQPGDETAKADAAEVAWKRVAAKQTTAAEAFALPKTDEPKDGAKGIEFRVGGVATTDVGGDPDWFVIKDDAEPANKVYTKDKKAADSAKACKKDGVKFVCSVSPRKIGDKTIQVID